MFDILDPRSTKRQFVANVSVAIQVNLNTHLKFQFYSKTKFHRNQNINESHFALLHSYSCYSFKFHCSPEMWAGVLFFLFCVGFVFYVFEHLNIWIQKNHYEPKKSNSNLNLVDSINIEMDATPFFSSKYIFKRVSKPI